MSDFDGKEIEVKVYKTDRLLTKQARENAERLDDIIERHVRAIEKDARRQGLLDLKGKPGVVRLWHEVGRHLSFVMDPSVVSLEDRKFVWLALYDHAGALAPGPPSVRAKERPANNHFYYCYLLAQFDADFALAAGHWTAWVEFFDSIAIKNDGRIIEWFARKQQAEKKTGQDWLRPIAKAVRHSLRNTDTTVFSDAELVSRLDSAYNSVYGEHASL